MQRKRRLATAVLIFIGSLLPFSLAHGQTAQSAFTVPRSNRVIFGELTLPDKSKVKFVARDGTWVTVEDYKGRYFYGFNGVINEETGEANFVPYELNFPEGTTVRELMIKGPAGPEASSPYVADPRRDVRLGESITYAEAKGIKLTVTGKGEWAFAAPFVSDVEQYSEEVLYQKFGVTGVADCCVTCQTRTICATAVETACGSCGSGGGGALEY